MKKSALNFSVKNPVRNASNKENSKLPCELKNLKKPNWENDETPTEAEAKNCLYELSDIDCNIRTSVTKPRKRYNASKQSTWGKFSPWKNKEDIEAGKEDKRYDEAHIVRKLRASQSVAKTRQHRASENRASEHRSDAIQEKESHSAYNRQLQQKMLVQFWSKIFPHPSEKGQKLEIEAQSCGISEEKRKVKNFSLIRINHEDKPSPQGVSKPVRKIKTFIDSRTEFVAVAENCKSKNQSIFLPEGNLSLQKGYAGYLKHFNSQDKASVNPSKSMETEVLQSIGKKPKDQRSVLCAKKYSKARKYYFQLKKQDPSYQSNNPLTKLLFDKYQQTIYPKNVII